jgi:hypothetical protein
LDFLRLARRSAHCARCSSIEKGFLRANYVPVTPSRAHQQRSLSHGSPEPFQQREPRASSTMPTISQTIWKIYIAVGLYPVERSQRHDRGRITSCSCMRGAHRAAHTPERSPSWHSPMRFVVLELASSSS